MFRYQHPRPSFGSRRVASAIAVRTAPARSDLELFVIAYLAGTAFTLAYLA